MVSISLKITDYAAFSYELIIAISQSGDVKVFTLTRLLITCTMKTQFFDDYLGNIYKQTCEICVAFFIFYIQNRQKFIFAISDKKGKLK